MYLQFNFRDFCTLQILCQSKQIKLEASCFLSGAVVKQFKTACKHLKNIRVDSKFSDASLFITELQIWKLILFIPQILSVVLVFLSNDSFEPSGSRIIVTLKSALNGTSHYVQIKSFMIFPESVNYCVCDQ